MPIVAHTHASFCIFEADDDVHLDTGGTECAGALVELAPDLSAWLVRAVDGPVMAHIDETRGLDLDAAAVDRMIGELLALRAGMGA